MKILHLNRVASWILLAYPTILMSLKRKEWGLFSARQSISLSHLPHRCQSQQHWAASESPCDLFKSERHRLKVVIYVSFGNISLGKQTTLKGGTRSQQWMANRKQTQRHVWRFLVSSCHAGNIFFFFFKFIFSFLNSPPTTVCISYSL